MSFTVPQFPIECDIYTTDATSKSYRLTSECNLALGRREVMPLSVSFPSDLASTYYGPFAQLLLPALTDIRDQSQGFSDLVECPSGSGRWYVVTGVDDFGKGFDNEHRVALITKIWGEAGLDNWDLPARWPTPMP